MVAIPIFDVMEVAIDALAENGSDKAIDALAKLMQHKNSSIRIKALVALVKSGIHAAVKDEAVNALISFIYALQAPDSAMRGEVRQEIIGCFESLVKSGNEKAIDAVTLLLQHADTKIRIMAATALVSTNNDKALNVLILNILISGLEEEDYFICKRVVEALGRIGNDRALMRHVIDALRYGYRQTKQNAAGVLGEIGNAEAVDFLITELFNEDVGVRRSVVEALGKIGDDRAVNFLFEVLFDEDIDIRHNAVEALKKIGNVASLEKLLQLPNLFIDVKFLSLARSWAIRFNESGASFIPVYPEVISASATTD